MLTTSVRALRLPGHALRARAAPVDFDAIPRELRASLAGGLAAALFRGPVGAGLAAPMLGVGLRVIIDAAEGPATAMFNPRIEETSGRMVAGEEGNLCLPGVRAEVRRAQTVTVSWQTLAGQDRTETFHDWHARVLQHEIEILDGRLFLDHEGVQPLGTMPMPDAQAERAAAVLFGEPEPERRRVEPVSVATFDPALWQLDPIVVRPPSAPGIELDPKFLRALAHGLFREQYERGGVGLAAPQVGLGLRLAAIDDREHPPVLLRDPEILDRSDETEIGPEGCLSLPGWRGPVERHVAIKVRNHTHRRRTGRAGVRGLPGARRPARDGPPGRRAVHRPHGARRRAGPVLRAAARGTGGSRGAAGRGGATARAHEIQAPPLTESSRTRNARTPSRGEGTRAMELAGLEPATSWVRSRHSPN